MNPRDKSWSPCPALLLAAALLAASAGCESSSSPSGDVDVAINFSGNYTANNIVPNKSNPTNGPATNSVVINRLTLQISGTSASVTDNNGSTYQGTLGDVLFDKAALGDISPDETIAHAQLSFSGYDAGSQKLIDFAGTLRAVALQEISGQSENIQATNGPKARYVFDLTPANTRYQLDGTWQEHQGLRSSASASAPAQSSQVVIYSGVK